MSRRAMRAYLAAFDAWLRDQTPELEDNRLRALQALRACRRGRPLSAREREVLVLRCAGESRAQIAVLLGITSHTVDRHFEHLQEKVGTSDPFRLALWAVKRGLVDL